MAIRIHVKMWIKYPRTYHLPWSPGATNDDKILSDLTPLEDSGEVVVTEKMDGENTSLYSDGIHARSLNYRPHESRTKIKAFHSSIQGNIPSGWRVCGENLTAVHSIEYTELPHIFLAFSVWDETNTCLSWSDTLDYLSMMDISPVPVLYQGPFSKDMLDQIDISGKEGYVVRPTSSFSFDQFSSLVAKYVRKNHVQTSTHWMHEKVRFNGVK